ncbi:MAG TPA: aspartate/glutamate racemase family protein, partial [Acetobacteraceae bacterium]|nr:aspartate/glutamate racemase family protein [Acetobacteraceae bacterium]
LRRSEEMTMQIDRRTRRVPVHGVTIGIMILDTGFQRLPGDIGYGPTWQFPVQYAVVRGATPDRIVRPNADGMLDLFLKAADELVALGVDGITTSCGFLAILHPQLVAHCPVPIATSSLLQIPLVQSILPKGQRVGVLTADAAALSPEHFRAVGVEPGLPVAGMPPDGVFRHNNRTGQPVVEQAAQEREVLGMAERLLTHHPDIGAIVSECTNLPPYSAKIEANFGVPVYDIITLVEWFHAGLRPRRYTA